jgi:hypothetical protein
MSTCSNLLPLEVLSAGQEGDALRTLFALVFGHPLNAAQWAWKYANAQSFHVICRDETGALIGHAAVQHTGCTASGVHVGQVGDVMVHPNHRGLLSGGVFARMLDLLAEEAVRRGFGLCYGFPGDRPARLGLRLGIYLEQLRPQEVHFLPERRRESVWARWVHPVTELSAQDAARWLDSTPGLTHRLGRFAAELRWRYLDAPCRYRFVAVGRGRQRKVAVFRTMDDGTVLLMDWVGDGGPTSDGVARMADLLGCLVRVWSHLLAVPVEVPRHDTPFVVIRLGKVPLPPELDGWTGCCFPGDVDVY